MSLIQYRIDLSMLTPEEREKLTAALESVSFNGFIPDANRLSGSFMIEKESDINHIDFPAACHLTRCQ